MDDVSFTKESFIVDKDSAGIKAEDQTKAFAAAQENMVNKELYSSYLYELLEQEGTKFRQYSTEKLFEMFLEEKIVER